MEHFPLIIEKFGGVFVDMQNVRNGAGYDTRQIFSKSSMENYFRRAKLAMKILSARRKMTAGHFVRMFDSKPRVVVDTLFGTIGQHRRELREFSVSKTWRDLIRALQHQNAYVIFRGFNISFVPLGTSCFPAPLPPHNFNAASITLGVNLQGIMASDGQAWQSGVVRDSGVCTGHIAVSQPLSLIEMAETATKLRGAATPVARMPKTALGIPWLYGYCWEGLLRARRFSRLCLGARCRSVTVEGFAIVSSVSAIITVGDPP